MKGDFTRFTFHPKKRYTSVRLQQGRVQLDADWNEQIDIQRYQFEAAQAAFIGSGTPIDSQGFAIGATATNDLTISPGRYYVGGLLCELFPDDAGNGLSYLTQPDLPRAPKLSDLGVGNYIVYMDVFTRHVTALEDPKLRELALGGPDTTTRTQTIWQVKLLPFGSTPLPLQSAAINVKGMLPQPTLRMQARAHTVVVPDGQLVPPGSGYVRLDNQLYRVEIHQGGKFATDAITFKWSRENGSIVTNWLGQNGNDILIGPTSPDDSLRFGVGSWIELTDDGRELRGDPGILCRVKNIDGPTLTIDPATIVGGGASSNTGGPGTITFSDFPNNPKVRRWDMATTTVPQAALNTWVALEDGVEICFVAPPGPVGPPDPANLAIPTGAAITNCRSGDYWLIPARCATRDIEWPQVNGTPTALYSHGVHHDYVDLAQFYYDGTSIINLADRRYKFPTLAALRDINPTTYHDLIYYHTHTGNSANASDGSQIPRGGIVNGAIDGTKIDPLSQVAIATLTTTGAVNLGSTLAVASNYLQKGTDLEISNDTSRGAAGAGKRRALVHDGGDQLVVNYSTAVNTADYSGGVRINGKVDLLANTSPVHFGNVWDVGWYNETTTAAICNDPTTFKALMLSGNRGNAPGAMRKVAVYDNLDVGNNYTQYGTDLQINNTASRGTGTGSRRALYHGSSDQLRINYNGEYTGGAWIDSALTVSGNVSTTGSQLLIDNTSARGGRSGTSRRAVVHESTDLLTLNYSGDYSNGVKINGQLYMEGRIGLDDYGLHLRGINDCNHGLRYAGSTRPFEGTNLDGPVLYGYGGGALGTVHAIKSGVEANVYLTGGSYIKANSAMSDTFTGGFSVELWVNWDVNTGASNPKFIDFGNGANSDNFMLGLSGTGNNVVFQTYSGSTASNTLTMLNAIAASTSGWIHFCVTIDSSNNAILYANAAQQASGSITLPKSISRSSCYIGKSNSASDGNFSGRLAQVRLWTRALSADEVNDHYNNSRPIVKTGLVGHWPLDDSTGTAVRDISGNSRTATATFSGNGTWEDAQNTALSWDSNKNVSVNGTLSVSSNYSQTGTDFQINNATSRGTGTGNRRALYHASSDQLRINYNGEYTGGAYVDSALTVSGDTTLSGNANVKGTYLNIQNSGNQGTRSGTTRRAMVHDTSDTLTINYSGDYSSGVQISGQLSMDGRIGLNNNTIYLRGISDINHGLRFAGSTQCFEGKDVNGPVLHGNGGGVLGTVSAPATGVDGSIFLTGGAYVSVPSITEDYSGGFSVEAWVKWDSVGSLLPSYSRILDFGTGQQGDNIILSCSGTANTLHFDVYNGTVSGGFLDKAGAIPVSPIAFIHVCGTVDANGNGILYKNGVAVATGTMALPKSSVARTSNFIGKSNWSSDSAFVGRIAQVRLWTRVLTSDEVSDHYQGTRAVNTSKLVGYWPLNDSTGTSARDLSGKSRNATLQLGTTSSYWDNYQSSALTWDSSKNVTVGNGLTVGGYTSINNNLGISGNFSMSGTDLTIDNSARRSGATGSYRRALVHLSLDQLHINYSGDYTGGTYVDSALTVSGRLKSANSKNQVYGSSGTVQGTNSTSWVDLDSMSMTGFTIGAGGGMFILATIGAVQPDTANCRGAFQIIYQISGGSWITVAISMQEYTTNTLSLRDVVMQAVVSNLSAGTYNIKVQWKVDYAQTGTPYIKCGWYSAYRTLSAQEF